MGIPLKIIPTTGRYLMYLYVLTYQGSMKINSSCFLCELVGRTCHPKIMSSSWVHCTVLSKSSRPASLKFPPFSCMHINIITYYYLYTTLRTECWAEIKKKCYPKKSSRIHYWDAIGVPNGEQENDLP